MPKALPAAGNKGFIVGPIHYQLLLLEGDVNTKSHGDCCRLRLFVVVGDASRKTSFPSCRPRHPQRHALHDDNSRHGQKAAFGRKKSPPLAVKKQLIASPLSMPNGQEFILAVFKEIVVRTFPLKKVVTAGVAPTAKRNPGLGKRNSITFRCALRRGSNLGSALLPHEGCLT